MSTEREIIITRKNFLKSTVLALSGLGLSSSGLEAFPFDIKGLFTRSSRSAPLDISIPSPIKSVIFVNMEGGMSHVDTLDPKPDSVFKRINSSLRGFPVMETFSKSSKHFGNLTAIRTTYSEDGDHAMAQHLLNTGYRTTETVGIPDLPHIGSIISYAKSTKKEGEPYFPTFVTMGVRNGKIGDSGYLPIQHAGFHVSDLNNPLSNMSPSWGKFEKDRLIRREEILSALNKEYSNQNLSLNLEKWDKMYKAAREFRDSDKLTGFDWKKEPERMQKKYGESWQARSFLLARRLAEIEVPFIQISIGGWDTHTDNRSRITKIMQETDQGLAALLEELNTSGLIKQTLFVLSSEFGRTPEVGGRDGRDHHPRVWTTLIGGGEISRGRVIGETDKHGVAPTPGSEAIHVRDLVASLYKYAGVDPKLKIMNTQNRPIGIGHPRSKAIKI